MGQHRALRPSERIKRALHERGLAGTSSFFLRFVCNAAKAWLWDFTHGVETRKRVWVDDLGILRTSASHAVHYEASAGEWLNVLRHLALPYEEFTFVDLGSGKGKCLLLASEFAFRKIIGVELSERLNQFAAQNVARYRSRDQKCRNIELVTANATEYEFPAGPVLVYMFQPFDETVMQIVIDNLLRSVISNPRAVYVLYRRPLSRHLFEKSPFFDLVDEHNDGVVYRTRSA